LSRCPTRPLLFLSRRSLLCLFPVRSQLQSLPQALRSRSCHRSPPRWSLLCRSQHRRPLL
jgi:hypothetical protein